MRRVQPRIGTTVRLAFRSKLELKSQASSPIVMPCTAGIGNMPMNERNAGSRTGPSTSSPPCGFGRSSTTTGFPASRAACMTIASVDT
ncbi:MAG: hypothetical protein QN178_14575 [Armatimonadota bacterium]|nr:hypothetical protein [Armatimonadota bacterium]